MTAPAESTTVDLSWVTFSEDHKNHWVCCNPHLALCGEVVDEVPLEGVEVDCERCIQLENVPCHSKDCDYG